MTWHVQLPDHSLDAAGSSWPHISAPGGLQEESWEGKVWTFKKRRAISWEQRNKVPEKPRAWGQKLEELSDTSNIQCGLFPPEERRTPGPSWALGNTVSSLCLAVCLEHARPVQCHRAVLDGSAHGLLATLVDSTLGSLRNKWGLCKLCTVPCPGRSRASYHYFCYTKLPFMYICIHYCVYYPPCSIYRQETWSLVMNVPSIDGENASFNLVNKHTGFHHTMEYITHLL